MTEELTHLIETAEHWAEKTMKDGGQVRPCFFFHFPGRNLGVFPYYSKGKDFDPEERELFAAFGRAIAVAGEVCSSIFISEAWIATQDQVDAVGADCPSETAVRQEYLIMTCEEMATPQPFMRMRKIVRQDNRNFHGFGEAEQPEYKNFFGRFTGILPRVAVPPNVREMAKLLLKAKGINLLKLK